MSLVDNWDVSYPYLTLPWVLPRFFNTSHCTLGEGVLFMES